ncbi:heparinase II/III domain-containing protein [Asticcacaulis machinosus]|uniref:Heparinase II/III family protein n=1 Tax=Asticcacaulis machinosus TaxID=2984211 RepID=A0ABT5HJ55_9CAUL|nr:heparinase II/III family protein [Asticcacaulis machinosus]MDC7676275.1 heparinase II/III family protein [Asticcacaulis machinosus]
MRRVHARLTTWIVSTSVAAVLIGALPVSLQAADTAPAVEVKARTFTVKPGAVHLSFSDDAIGAFKGRIANNAEVAGQWQKIKAEADRQVALPLKDLIRDGRRLPDTLEPLILAYRMTGEARYSQKLHEVLRAFCAQQNLVTDAPLLKRDPVWNSDLGMGFSGEMFGLIYDSIRGSLSPAERRELTSGYIQKLVTPVFNDWIDGRQRIHTLDTMGHNWWAHIVFGTGVGLVAISRDDPRAAAYLDRLETAGSEWWSYKGSRIESKVETFDADGGNLESVNYAELAVGTYLEFRLAWQEMFKEAPADIPVLEKSVDFLIHNAYPTRTKLLHVNFGDGNIDKNYSRTAANYWLTGKKRPQDLWYMTQSATAGDGVDIRYRPRYLVQMPLATEKDGAGRQPDLPLSAWYRGMGWATLRTSWDADATLLAIRSGYTWNHSHADAGSFVLFHKGKPLLIDSGNSSYGRKEYDGYYRQTQAHNVATFNGKAEPAEDTYISSHLSGQIPNMLDGAGLRYVFADATGPTSANFARNFRHFLWVDGVILIYDDLKAREPGQFAFQLHTEGETKRQGQNLIVKNGEASVQVRPLFPAPFPDAGLPTDYPENMRLEELSGYKDHAPDTRTTYYAFRPQDKVERQKFITAIIPQDDGPVPQIERLSGPDMIGARIRRDGRITDVYINLKADGSIKHRNATTTLMGWQTDAYMLSVTYKDGAQPAPETIERLFIADGSYLRHGDKLMLDSLSKRFVIADYKRAPAFWVQGQSDAELGLWLPRLSGQIRVNDQNISVTGKDRFVRLKCC